MQINHRHVALPRVELADVMLRARTAPDMLSRLEHIRWNSMVLYVRADKQMDNRFAGATICVSSFVG